eukprot:gene4900-5982_t
MTKGNSVLRLLEGFPVSLHDSLDAGRIIVASKALEAAQEAVHTAEVCAARRSANDEAESFSSRENGGSIDAELSTLQHSEMHLLLDMLARRAYRYSLLTAIDHCSPPVVELLIRYRLLAYPQSGVTLFVGEDQESKLAAADTLDDVSIIAPSVASAPCGLTALALDKATSAEATDSSSSTSACEGLAGSSVPLPTFDEGLALWKPSPELLREFGHHEHNTSKESRMMEAATAVVRLAPSVLLE